MAGSFHNAQVNCKKYDVVFGKLKTKNSYGFSGCSITLMLAFVTYLLLPSRPGISGFHLHSQFTSTEFRDIFIFFTLLHSSCILIHLLFTHLLICSSIYPFILYSFLFGINFLGFGALWVIKQHKNIEDKT